MERNPLSKLDLTRIWWNKFLKIWDVPPYFNRNTSKFHSLLAGLLYSKRRHQQLMQTKPIFDTVVSINGNGSGALQLTG